MSNGTNKNSIDDTQGVTVSVIKGSGLQASSINEGDEYENVKSPTKR